MKTTAYLFLTFLIYSTTINAQSIGLMDIVQKPSSEFRANVKADQYGGNISFNRMYKSQKCVGTYNINWRFNKDISTLQNGEKFTVTISCANCKTPCGFRWGLAKASAANNVTKINKYPNYTYNGNISLVTTTASSSGVHDWYPGHTQHDYTFTYKKFKNAPLTAFYLEFAGHVIYYVYKEGATVSKPANCHTLLGLGKLVYGIEIGAYEGYGWDWMDKTIDYALNHVKASNCLSNTYLLDLKRRIYKAPNTKIFLEEIRAYSTRLETEVASSCNCCSGN